VSGPGMDRAVTRSRSVVKPPQAPAPPLARPLCNLPSVASVAARRSPVKSGDGQGGCGGRGLGGGGRGGGWGEAGVAVQGTGSLKNEKQSDEAGF